MDKASIIRDAIEHIKSLQEEEGKIQAEISNLESNGAVSEIDYLEGTQPPCSKPKRTRIEQPSPIEVLEVAFLNYFLLIVTGEFYRGNISCTVFNC